MIGLIIIDASCVAYLLESNIKGFNDPDPLTREGMIRWMDERLFLNSATPCKVVWALDCPPYWRSYYEPDYKAHRGKSNIDISPTLEIIRALPNAIEEPSYEADDVAAALCKQWEGQTLLLTSDSDWQGMISDDTWVLSPQFEPRIRGLTEAYGWLCTQHKKLSKYNQTRYRIPPIYDFDPRQIWAFKSQFGDSGDNLPPQTNPALIDLLEPLQDIATDYRPLLNELPALPYCSKRAAQYISALPDIPFNPIRMGNEFI